MRYILKIVYSWTNRNLWIVMTLLYLLCQYNIYRVYGIKGLLSDVDSYTSAALLLMSGGVDVLRMPSYPIIIGLCHWLCDSNTEFMLIALQILIFYLSVYSLYGILCRLRITKNITIIISALYAFNPMLLCANLIMMPESFTVSIGVFLIYYFVKWMQNGKRSDICKMLLCTLLVIFMRFALLYILVAMAVIVCLLVKKNEIRKGLQLSVIIVILSGLMCGYCKIIESRIGVFTPSTVSIHNDYCNAVNIGKLASKNVTDTVIKRRAVEFEGRGGSRESFVGPDVNDLPPKQVYDELQYMKKKDKLMYVKFFVVNCKESLYNQYGSFLQFDIDFRIIYLFLTVFGIGVVYGIIKQRQISLITLFIWFICVGNILTDLTLSYSEWSRLFLPSLPLLLILIAWCCNFFRIRYEAKEIM